MRTNWRNLDTETRNTFLEWVYDSNKERNALGRERYGDTFQGDPLEHAIEEALDLLFYLWAAKRREKERE